MATTRSKSKSICVKDKTRLLFEYPDRRDNPTKSVISITQHDLNLLKTPKFLNDTIISFFMQYYLDNVAPRYRDKIYIFNSFFFAKIKAIRAKRDDEDATYKCASRWLGKIQLFEKDFLVMPVCEKEHWLLVIICYIASKPSLNPKLIPDNELREPAVIVLNSWYGCAPSVKRTLNKFLRYQWHVEREELRNFRIHDAKPGGIRLLFPNVPQQKNNYNCGVYLLSFFYCFLKNPRDTYVRMFRKRDMTDWFKQNNLDIGCQRRKMTTMIHQLIKDWKGLPQDSQEERSDHSSSTQQDISEIDDQDVIVIH